MEKRYGNEYLPLLNTFEIFVTARLLGINSQALITEQDNLKSLELSPAMITLSLFLKRLAQHFWGKEIEVIFYSRADGAVAHTYSGSNQLFVNLTQYVDLFKKFYKDWQTDNTSLSFDQMQVIIKWVDTLTHELTHMAEDTNCASTHDVNFKSRMAKQLLPLFIKNQKDSHVLSILFELFSQSIEPQLKKQRISIKKEKPIK